MVANEETWVFLRMELFLLSLIFICLVRATIWFSLLQDYVSDVLIVFIINRIMPCPLTLAHIVNRDKVTMSNQVIDWHIYELCVEFEVAAELTIRDCSPLVMFHFFRVVVFYSRPPFDWYFSDDELFWWNFTSVPFLSVVIMFSFLFVV